MIYVVDIVGPSGDRATKEYEASSIRAAVRLAELELRHYPKCQITDIRLKWEWEWEWDLHAESDDW
jgi:hypothetical protein